MPIFMQGYVKPGAAATGKKKEEESMSVSKVWIDDECTLCGVCEDLCPEVFLMGDETTEVVAGADLAASTDCIIDAANNCPVEIIKYEE